MMKTIHHKADIAAEAGISALWWTLFNRARMDGVSNVSVVSQKAVGDSLRSGILNDTNARL